MKKMLLLGACLALSACATEQAPLTDYTVNSGAERAPEQIAVVFEHADLKLRIDPAARSIRGDAALTFLAQAAIARIVLDLDRNLAIDSISLDGAPLPPAAYSNPQGRLSITLPQMLAAGARSTVRVVYHGVPHVARNAPWDGGFVWSHTSGTSGATGGGASNGAGAGAAGQPWIATAVEGEGCDLFWPCIDHPMGKPLLVDQHITIPAPLVSAGNGVAMGMDEAKGWRTYHWRTKNPSTYGIALNIGPYEVLADDYASRYGNTIPLRFWYVRGNEAQARVLFKEFKPMLDFLESVIGPYPFADEKMGVVETPYKGMEHQTINAYGNKYAKTAYGYDDLLQHELSHEWFGNQMTNANWDDMWLHEGFASYMQPLYMEYLRGEQEYFASLMKMRAGITNTSPVVSGLPKREEDVYETRRGGPGGDIYSKGALILHTLRGLIGDDAFFRSVKLLVYGTETPRPGNFQPRYGSTREYIGFVNQTTGKDMNWFFDVYLYQAALPDLQAQRQGEQLLLSWKTEGNKAFPMPVEVRVGNHIVSVPMTDGRGQLALPAGATYTLDPHSKILRREAHIEAFQQYQEAQRKLKTR
ncbi:MAG TPA: M1 family metallopeptidase [Janthinobacterium sp.]|nr:M1 family metallopeptidase [Janthinobacterium sp.]